MGFGRGVGKGFDKRGDGEGRVLIGEELGRGGVWGEDWGGGSWEGLREGVGRVLRWELGMVVVGEGMGRKGLIGEAVGEESG